MAAESVYTKMDVCKFNSYEDFRWATRCCTDEAMASLGNGLTSLCLNYLGNPEPCEYTEPSICCPGGSGLLLPFMESEVEWFIGARTVLYGFILAWMLLGIMLISDVFMSAIEEITGQETEKTVIVNGEKTTATVKVWNDTMANLTLMALGSSAPEILLSVVELFQQRFYSGRLGSSTIVGSAAFNLFVITAVCITAIPSGEVRYIAEVPVYCVTLAWSLLAYIWVLVVVQINTPEMIDLWEALATLGFMPCLLAMAFAADKGLICKCVAIDDDRKVAPGEQNGSMDDVVPGDQSAEDAQRDELARILKQCQDKYGDRAEERAVERIIKLKASSAHLKSRAYYRVIATRGMVGGQKALRRTITAHGGPPMSKVRKSINQLMSDGVDDEDTVIIEFAAPFYSCLESEGSLEVHVIRSGPPDCECSVHYKTRDGTAVAGEDFTYQEGDLIFEAGEMEAIIEIPIIDDDSHEPDEDFFIDLTNPVCKGKEHIIKLGEMKAAVVTIIDDDDPGVLYFADDDFYATEAEGVSKIWVARKDGCSANVSCMYFTEDGTGKDGIDYEEARGRIEFLKGETRKNIDIKILNDVKYKKDVSFKVYLEHPTGGAKFEAKSGDQCVTTVHVSEAKSNQGKIDTLFKHMNTMMADDGVRLGKESWQDQFIAALYVNGSKEDQDSASAVDWVWHFFCASVQAHLCDGASADYL
jgi:solute carrier family 8 (sodium/calcium exchanger)